ncbi:hypothetical protein QJ857_gp0549 [Tupanvirus soda lake]|uniref:Uncharacterized protein n=2 Tax=Tupanvirus TaxID=2094720 RepID=A0A6N1P0B3_9VIRU|nr:hypothetical protein QJ857_gp0549 [Tupanvirus soda lake]QKU35492.1 hypothetical protein [Tupanvirus soda lake]
MQIVSTNFESFDSLEISELETSYCQPLAFINYNKELFAIKTDPIRITSYGIPKLDNNFYPCDDKREFIKIGFDMNQPGCVQLKLFFEKADKFFGSRQMKKKLFGKKEKYYEYQPIIKTGCQYDKDDEDDVDFVKKNKINKPMKPDYCKVKFITKNSESREIVLKLKKHNEDIKAVTVTEIEQYVKYAGIYAFTIQFRKVWASKSFIPCTKLKYYSVGLSMIEIDTSPTYTYFDKPIYDIQTLKNTYKKYMEEKKKAIHTQIAFDV